METQARMKVHRSYARRKEVKSSTHYREELLPLTGPLRDLVGEQLCPDSPDTENIHSQFANIQDLRRRSLNYTVRVEEKMMDDAC